MLNIPASKRRKTSVKRGSKSVLVDAKESLQHKVCIDCEEDFMKWHKAEMRKNVLMCLGTCGFIVMVFAVIAAIMFSVYSQYTACEGDSPPAFCITVSSDPC